MTASDERGPGFPGIIGGRHRRSDQRNGKSGKRKPVHTPRLLGTLS